MGFKATKIIFTLLRYLGWFFLIILAAILFRVFVAEVYYIPSGSMNSTLYEGDIIVVNKLRYGAVLPQSPADMPLVPAIMIIKPIREWLMDINWGFYRILGYSYPKYGDVIVFKLLEGGLIIKRCVAMPGDTLNITHDTLFVNNKIQPLPDSAMFHYFFFNKIGNYSDSILQKYILRKGNIVEANANWTKVCLTTKFAKELSKQTGVESVIYAEDKSIDRYNAFFPYKAALKWNCSNYGPVVVPKKGVRVSLDTVNLIFYERIIRDYEENDMYISDNKIFINGQKVNSYTFKMDYYFMMGDSRYNSIDSRFVGFIPAKNIIGKASFIIFSQEKDNWQRNGVRWRRIFKQI